jgi:hypothetical protein
LAAILLFVIRIVSIAFDVDFIFFDERVLEVIDIDEIVDTIFRRLTENPCVHHIDDDIAEIDRFRDAPMFEHHLTHGAVFFDCQSTNSLEELSSSDMPLDSHCLPGVMQGFDHKEVPLGGIARILGDDFFQFPHIGHAVV